MTGSRQLAWLDAAEGFVCSELGLCKLGLAEGSDPGEQSRLRDSPELERERDGVRRRALDGGGDDSGPSQACAVEVRGHGDDQDGLQHAGQRVALPKETCAPQPSFF